MMSINRIDLSSRKIKSQQLTHRRWAPWVDEILVVGRMPRPEVRCPTNRRAHAAREGASPTLQQQRCDAHPPTISSTVHRRPRITYAACGIGVCTCIEEKADDIDGGCFRISVPDERSYLGLLSVEAAVSKLARAEEHGFGARTGDVEGRVANVVLPANSGEVGQ